MMLPLAGQYHKGGPPLGAFPQVTGALRRRGRPAIRPRLRDRPAGIAQLPAAAFPEGVG